MLFFSLTDAIMCLHVEIIAFLLLFFESAIIRNDNSFKPIADTNGYICLHVLCV